jgi:hypothetical protein
MSAANPNERKTANHVPGNGRSFRFRRLELIDIVFCRTELAKDMAVLVAGEQQVRNDLAAPIAEMVPMLFTDISSRLNQGECNVRVYRPCRSSEWIVLWECIVRVRQPD